MVGGEKALDAVHALPSGHVRADALEMQRQVSHRERRKGVHGVTPSWKKHLPRVVRRCGERE